MNILQIKKLLIRGSALYWALALMIFLVAGDGFRFSAKEGSSLSPSIVVGELTDGSEVTQTLTVDVDRLDSVSVCVATYGRQNTGVLHLEVLDAQGAVLAEAAADISTAADGGYLLFSLSERLEGLSGQTVTLRFTSEGCQPGNAITFYAGTSVDTTRISVEKELTQENLYRLDGQVGTGMLCMKYTGVTYLSAYLYYWPLVAVAYAVAAAYALRSYNAMKQGRNSFFVAFGIMLTKYSFLIKQLVSRDFKTKYKRSVLGVAWSFLNPLLTTLVQYVVFSTLFKSSIENFPVYLLSGSVFFSFFNEAVSMGMSSIIGNASLIKKVYVPKYIYPISRVLSSLVNFALAFAPLLLMMIVTGVSFHVSLLLLIYDVICFLGFITGMVLILSTMVVFFQDVQFLWGVASMMWSYLTPIFYPESIIPDKYLFLYHLNPLYQYINFARTCILSGISPHPQAYLGCLLPAVVFLGLGIYIFRRHQDKFVMYV